MVEDHSAGTEYTAAEYTGVDQPEDKYRGDGEPPLNRYTLGSGEQPGTTNADLRPEPGTDFRSELPHAPTPDQLDFLVPPPAPRRPRPENHLSPSLPIPMPEPLAPRAEPDEYRTELERAATELPTGQPPLRQTPPAPEPTGFPEQPTSTSYFAAAPSVSGSQWRTDQTASWNSDQHHPEPADDEQPAYRDYPAESARPFEPPVERAAEQPRQVEQAVERPVDGPVGRPDEQQMQQPADGPMERSVERADERAGEHPGDRSVEPSHEHPTERAVEQTDERPTERPDVRFAEQDERLAERAPDHAVERPREQADERPAERVDERA
ncbi:hypothetical protein ABZS29_10170, partial [Kribbella sp. NPDC005582]|uniref:hypothetical protein n=1 Tax=Kribbella sp. NPDC005582 TaxID=3156893 RepID=UPI0033BAC724